MMGGKKERVGQLNNASSCSTRTRGRCEKYEATAGASRGERPIRAQRGARLGIMGRLGGYTSLSPNSDTYPSSENLERE